MSTAFAGHSAAFRRRRFLNWFPLGLTYALLYMGRYNLTVSKNALGELMTKEDFGVIFGAGTITYGLAFLLNGPLTDRMGGKRAMLISACGAAVMNVIMGLYVSAAVAGRGGTDLRLTFSLLYAANMYFQSFGAVAIVKVNAHWFHVRERGGFSGIFGTMIASGIFLAFTVNQWILDLATSAGDARALATRWVFYVPAAALLLLAVFELLVLRDRPGLAGLKDFDTGDASSGEGEVRLRVVLKRILTNPVILTVALVELCTGVLRNGVMQWYPIYTKEVLALPGSHALRNGSWSAWSVVLIAFAASALFFVLATRVKGPRKGWLYVSGGLLFLAPFLSGGWGGLLMVAGVIGGNVAGWVSDLFFQSRRAPAAGGLYALLCVAAIAMVFTLGGTTREVGWVEAPKLKEGQAAPAPDEQLLVGDQVLAIAGASDIADWSDVANAVACVPASCQGGAAFDVERCICTMDPHRVDPAKPLSSGTLEATVLRAGHQLNLRLRDPGSAMRAGDRRELKAGPVLTMSPIWLGIVVFLMSMCVIGTHGLLSGTATMDFGGRRGAATAVGIIDGFVYLGTAVQSLSLGFLTTESWSYWPLFLLPFAIAGTVLIRRIWHAKPRGGGH